MKILIAEDDPVSVKVLQFTLQHFGHEVVVAANGQEAWTKFDENPVRVIVSDWMMPGMSGLELCEKVRNRPRTEYTYFILLTAINTDRDNLREAMASGIDDFLSKPVNKLELVTRVRSLLRVALLKRKLTELLANQ